MRVDLTTFGLEPPEQGKTGRAGQTAATGTGAGSASSSASNLDETKFSFDPTRVQSLEAQVLAQPEIRAARVLSLQQAIANGSYSVSDSQVADAMTAELTGTWG